MPGKSKETPNPKQAKKRPCLRCQKTFLSMSFANRICPKCSSENSRKSGLRVPMTRGGDESDDDD